MFGHDFNILEADQEEGCVTIVVSKNFLPTLSWALRHCPDNANDQRMARILSSHLFQVTRWLRGLLPTARLVNRKNRPLVEIVIDENGHETRLREENDFGHDYMNPNDKNKLAQAS